MDASEKVVFDKVIGVFQTEYPDRNIEIVRDSDRQVVCIDGKQRFCITGFNLLYCLRKLTECLEDELL